MSRKMPNNPFLVVRGLDQTMVRSLAAECDAAYASTGNPVFQERAVFLRNLEPLVVAYPGVRSEAEVAAVRARVRDMVAVRLPSAQEFPSKVLQ